MLKNLISSLFFLILLPYLIVAQDKQSKYVVSVIGGADFIADRQFTDGGWEEKSVNKQPGLSLAGWLGYSNGRDHYPAIGIRYINRAGSFVSSTSSLGGWIYESGNFELQRGDVIAAYYFPLGRRGFATFGAGLYGGFLLGASGSAYTSHWSMSMYEPAYEDIPIENAIEKTTFGMILDFRFNIPLHQKHFVTFSLNMMFESWQVNAPGRTIGIGIGYTFRKLKKKKALENSSPN